MKEKMVLIKKYSFHLIVIGILIIYLLSSDLLFDRVITVKGESRIVAMDPAAASKDIRYSIDSIYDNKVEWKEMTTINGWGFIDNQTTENSSIFLVFSGENSRYTFTTIPILRRDVTKHFTNISKNNLNLDNSGFEANIPRFFIDKGNYTIGILIKNQTAQRYIITKSYCTKGNCSVIKPGMGG